ncbi:MAG: T9SS C-terminal target domain-containing protein [Cytophagales bacterium]|nr:MAG: T9SS C-terminal target domain-containing protein [Cytophagales bacterium]
MSKIKTILFFITFLTNSLFLFAQKPKAIIITPLTGKTYSGGEEIPFVGQGTDQIDGELSADAFRWIIVMNHGIGQAQHWHDGIALYDGIKEGLFQSPIADDHTLSDSIFFRIYLIVRNSKGIRDTTFVDLNPKQSKITIASEPSGIKLNLQGYGALATPILANPTQNMLFIITAAQSQTLDGKTYTFKEWENGSKDLTRAFNVPSEASTIKAIYTVVNSTEERLSKDVLRVCPNPVIDKLYLKSTDLILNNSFYEILSINGQKMNVNSNTNSLELQSIIDVSSLNQGVYFIKVSTSKGYGLFPFVKQ